MTFARRFGCLLALTAVCACRGEIPTPSTGPVNDSLLEVARSAKARGERRVDRVLTGGSLGEDRTFHSVVFDHSVIVGRATAQVITDTSNPQIVTWRVFGNVNTGSVREPRDPFWCTAALPASLTLQPDEFVVTLSTGSAEIEGVVVSTVSAESNLRFETGEHYLFIAIQCPSRLVRLPLGKYSVYAIDRNTNELKDLPGNEVGRRPFVRTLVSERTADAVIARARHENTR